MDKPLTDRVSDAAAERQAYCYAYGKRAAQDIGEAFLHGVEYQKRRQAALLAALKRVRALIGTGGDESPIPADIAQESRTLHIPVLLRSNATRRRIARLCGVKL